MALPSLPPLPVKCKVILPSENDAVRDCLDRWSDNSISLPAAVVVPDTEDDIITCLQYAQTHKLRVVVAGGHNAPFVPVTRHTFYLDMKNFQSLRVDETTTTVTFGGGMLTGQLLSHLAERGYYTTLPFSSAVGVVGAVLGGGNNPFTSLHGFMVDNVAQVRIITADGVAHDISPSSSNSDERALFNAVCGAGHGLGVISSLTLRIYRVSSLSLDEGDKIWQRQAVFPGANIRDAARTMASILPVKGSASVALIVARSPAGSPRPGAPVIVVQGLYFGPSAEAERWEGARVLGSPEVAEKAVMTATKGIPLIQMNDITKASEVHGGVKILDGTFVSSLDEDTIVALFERYLAFTEGRPDTWSSNIAIAAWDKTKILENGRSEERKGNLFEPRDRGVLVMGAMWSKEKDSETEGRKFLREVKETAMHGEPGRIITFANNLALPADLREVYSEDNIQRLEKIKQRWDSNGLFWSPAMGDS